MEALGHFGVDAQVVGSVSGPHVTRYELRLAPGIKMSKVANMRDDLAYALAADDVRILAPIPGKRAVGIEVPNKLRQMVHLGDVAQEAPEGWSPLTVWLGKDIDGKAIGIDLAGQPHVLVAGTTGSGKSGCVNAMLSSILMRASPNEVRMVLIDPKQVELNLYEHIPHLLTPVVTSPRLAANVLQNLIREMEERYTLMSSARTRKLEELNRLRVREGERPLPYLLCVIDELADLMMIAPGEVEDAIIRLAQKSRAVGIHLLLATQRPSVDIITGMIKTNVPARIAFAVSSQTDSRVILDQNGAESLLGKGDMLFKPGNGTKLSRIQGAFVGEEEIEKITAHWRKQGEPELREELLEAVESDEEEEPAGDFDPDAGRPAGRGDPNGRADGYRLHVDAPAPPARGIHPGGPADRHARAPRRDLGLRGLEGTQGAHHGSRPPAGAGRPGGARGRRTARIGGGCRRLVRRSGRRACARSSTSPMSRSARRSVRSTCARSRTRSGACCPGPTFVKTFLRTYAEVVGVDPHLLVEEYRTQHEADEPPGPAADSGAPARAAPAPPAARRRSGPPGRLPVIGALVGGRRRLPARPRSGRRRRRRRRRRRHEAARTQATETAPARAKPKPKPKPAPTGVTVRIAPDGPTYACLDTGDGTDRLFEGTLEEARTFSNAKELRVNLGRRRRVDQGQRQGREDHAEPGAAGPARSRARGAKEITEGPRPCA